MHPTLTHIVDRIYYSFQELLFRDPSVTHLPAIRSERSLTQNPFRNPKRFFRGFSSKKPPPDWYPIEGSERTGKKIRKSEFWFPSPLPSGIPRNDRVGNLYYQQIHNPTGPHVIIAPPYRQMNYLYLSGVAKKFARAGYSSIVTEAPYHMGRTPPHENPGFGMLSANLPRCLKSIRQAVKDITCLIQALRIRGVQEIVLYGASMGGLITGLATCHDPRISASILVVPATAPGSIVFSAWIMRRIAHNLLRLGFSREEATTLLNSVDLAQFQPAIPPEKILMFEGTHDEVVPVDEVEKTWNAWGKGPIVRLPHGHLSAILLEPSLFPTIFEFLDSNLHSSNLDPSS